MEYLHSVHHLCDPGFAGHEYVHHLLSESVVYPKLKVLNCCRNLGLYKGLVAAGGPGEGAQVPIAHCGYHLEKRWSEKRVWIHQVAYHAGARLQSWMFAWMRPLKGTSPSMRRWSGSIGKLAGEQGVTWLKMSVGHTQYVLWPELCVLGIKGQRRKRAIHDTPRWQTRNTS